MATTFLTLPVIAARALATLYNATVAIGLVHRDYDQDFAGKIGDTVNVRVPIVFNATRFDRSKGIQLQDAGEDTFPVVLDSVADVSFPVTSEDMTLAIDNFADRLLTPAMEAIVQQVEGDLIAELIAAASQTASTSPGADYVARQHGGGVVSTGDVNEPIKSLVPARVVLGRNKLPTVNRFALFSPEAAGAVLEGDLVVQANTRGDTDGLVEASIGRKFGFDSYESNRLGYGPGDPGKADGVAFHQDAITLASRTLEIPLGKVGAQAAIAQYKGLGLRVVYDYDITYKQTVVSVDFLYGVRAVRPQGAVELDLHQGS